MWMKNRIKPNSRFLPKISIFIATERQTHSKWTSLCKPLRLVSWMNSPVTRASRDYFVHTWLHKFSPALGRTFSVDYTCNTIRRR